MSKQQNPDSLVQVILPTKDLSLNMNFFSDLGFRLDNIFPSDEPAVAIMSGHGLCIRLDNSANGTPVTLHLLTDFPEHFSKDESILTAPNGTLIKILPRSYALNIPTTQHKFEVRQLQDKAPWVIGRAGMLYRDLIPDRLGGGIIASHIRIPHGGPVPDMVHYHTIGFQLIFCYKGWVKLVYEDQGDPFILEAGDCVTQPPEIRHRVLEASDNLEVIEIGVPAEHMTTIDHEMTLPTKNYRPEREFKGQRFCHHQIRNALWAPWRTPGFKFRETGINEATKGVASVQVVQAMDAKAIKPELSHDCDILFTFVMQGQMQLKAEGHELESLKPGDAYVTPPHLKHCITNFSEDLELLEVALPGKFKTIEY